MKDLMQHLVFVSFIGQKRLSIVSWIVDVTLCVIPSSVNTNLVICVCGLLDASDLTLAVTNSSYNYVQDCTTSTACPRPWTARTGKVCSDYTTTALWLVLACLLTATKQTGTTLRGSKSPPPSHCRFVSGYLALYKFGLTFVSLTLYTTSIQPSFPLSWCLVNFG